MPKNMMKVYGTFIYGNNPKFPNYDTYSILAYICDVCNYQCSYCYNHFPRSTNFLDLDKVYNFVENIAKQKKVVYLDLIGGEPTLHGGLFRLCEKIQQTLPNVKIAIYSNFRCNVDYYKQLIEYGCELILSHHYLCNTNEFLDKIKQFTSEERKKLTMMVMFEHEYSERCFKVFDELEQIGGFGELNIVSLNNTENYNEEYAEHQLEEFEKRARRTKTQTTIVEYDDGSKEMVDDNFFFLNKKNENFKWWMCHVGKDFCYIHHDGTIHPCDENDGIILGSIYQTKQFEIPKKPMICKRESCPCLFDIYKERVLKND